VSDQATTVTPEAPPPSFENFMDAQIGAVLKENPKTPSLNKDAPPGEVSAPVEQQQQPTAKTIAIPETTPEQAAKALLPDFSKLAFGQQIEKVAPELTPEIKKVTAVPDSEHEEFPEKPPGATTPQAEATWAKMRTSNQALWKQNAELTAKLKEHEEKLKEFDGKTPMASDEFERLTNERETLSKELRLVKLEATPEYQKAVGRPMLAIEDEIKRLGTKYSVNGHQIRSALTEADRDKQADQLSRVTETFNDRDKLTLFKLADDTKEILRRRTVLQQDVKQALDYIEAKRSAEAEKAKAEKTTEWSGAQKKAWKVIGDELYLARPLEGNEDWNKGLQQTQALVANTDLDALDHIDRAKVLVQAALLPRAVIAIHQLWNMYQEAATALKRYQGVTPGAGGGAFSAGESNGAEPSTGESDMSFIDAIESKIGGRR
jgi:hypothetical protein